MHIDILIAQNRNGSKRPRTYLDDRMWSDTFIPLIREIVGPHLLQVAPVERDIKQATDFTMLKARDMAIACRLRQPHYQNYFNQFTIRAHRATGTKTELEKIVEGWADLMFYAHLNETFDDFKCWHLLDLDSFRTHWKNRDRDQEIFYGPVPNKDGTEGIWFDIYSFPQQPPIVVAAKNPSRPFKLNSLTSLASYLTSP